MKCDCDHLSDIFKTHYYNCSSVWDEKETGYPCPKNSDGTLRLRNPLLQDLDRDVIYHLGLDTDADLPALFGDVKVMSRDVYLWWARIPKPQERDVINFLELTPMLPALLVGNVNMGFITTMTKQCMEVKFVCMGGTKQRMREFAVHMRQALGLPDDGKLVNLTKHAHRYTMYKVGPVISVSHGIGIPSMSVVLQEMFKLLHYARARDPVFFRVGTSGGLGVPPGSVVVSAWALNGTLEKTYEIPVLGKVRKLPALFDERLCQEVQASASGDQYNTYVGGTMAADDFYRGQGRLDGPFCDYSEEDKMAFLRTITDLGVKNIEMEATAFAAYTREAGVRAADICVTFLDRLLGDQVTPSKSQLLEWQTRPIAVVARFISQYCQRQSAVNASH